MRSGACPGVIRQGQRPGFGAPGFMGNSGAMSAGEAFDVSTVKDIVSASPGYLEILSKAG